MPVMNPALFKLKISQARCPIYTGQILPLLPDKLKLNQQDSLNYGFYKVESVSRQQSIGSKNKRDNYHLALTPVEWDPVNFSWLPVKESSVSPHPFDISISSEDLHDTFGIYTTVTSSRATEGAISKYIETLFKKAGKLSEFKDKYSNIDFDKIFRIIALKAIKKSGLKLKRVDQEDIFHNALLQLAETNVINKFDENKGNFINFLWGSFYFGILDEINKFKKSNQYETIVKKVDLSEDNKLNNTNNLLSMEEKINSTQIVEDFKKYLSKESSGKRLVIIVEMLMEKFSQKEIAEKLDGISTVRIFQLIQRIISKLKEYAEDSKNDLLLEAIETAIKRRKSAEEESNILLEIFKIYDEKINNSNSDYTAAGEDIKLAERVPVGETIKIKRRPLPNFEELTKKIVQDPEKSSSQATKDINAYLQSIISADELIEHEGKLIALNIQRK